MQIDVAPTDHRAVLDGCQQFLSVLNILAIFAQRLEKVKIRVC
jgi:hypothetical protein